MVEGKKILVVGLANKYSIAAAIAETLHKNGATLGFSYQSERFEKFINEFASQNGNGLLKYATYPTIRILKNLLHQQLKRGEIDGIVHSVVLRQLIRSRVTLKIVLLEKAFKSHMISVHTAFQAF
ncbi:MAG: hypothetical protein CM15mP31_2630 [Gammaproteobacteria bacterium]|nr:MAG: hypothetical protein CM15mP31_2630 [Gammaproteobacteria bacterium]